MLATPENVETAIVLVVVGDRGLSGPYNSSALRAGDRLVHMLQHQGTNVRLFTVGKKAPAFFRFRGIEVEQSFTGFADRPTFADARLVASTLAAPFVAGEVQQVLLVSTRFLSAGSQVVESEQLLPARRCPSDIGDRHVRAASRATPNSSPRSSSSSPSSPRERSRARSSRRSSRARRRFTLSQQRAMAAATDNADELGQTLTRIMNRARQDSITTEIMEIVGGAEALRSGK